MEALMMFPKPSCFPVRAFGVRQWKIITKININQHNGYDDNNNNDYSSSSVAGPDGSSDDNNKNRNSRNNNNTNKDNGL